MYNRYIPSGEAYQRIPEEDSPQRHFPDGQHAREDGRDGSRRPPPRDTKGLLEGLTGKLGGVLKGHKLEKPDSGDILLVLILLFLFLESDDNLELVITLGLLLLFGLFGKDGEGEKTEKGEE